MTLEPIRCPHCGCATLPDEEHCGWCGEWIEQENESVLNANGVYGTEMGPEEKEEIFGDMLDLE